MAYLPAAIAMQAAGLRPRVSVLAYFDFVSGPWRCWFGTKTLHVAGLEWQGLGQLIDVDSIEQLINGSTERMTFVASGVQQQDNPELDVFTILARDTAEAEGREVTLYLQFFDENWKPIDAPVVLRTGIMDAFSINEQRQANGELQRTVTVEAGSPYATRTRRGLSTYTTPEQQRLHPGDLIFDRVPDMQNNVVVFPDW